MNGSGTRKGANEKRGERKKGTQLILDRDRVVVKTRECHVDLESARPVFAFTF